MALEIEHKYLADSDEYRSMATVSHELRQGYLSREPERTVRVRIVDKRGYITIKGITRTCVRQEFEYGIPYEDAVEMLAMCIPPLVEKTRYIVPYEGKKWEVDEFHGALAPLVLAEIELTSPDEAYAKPSFIGRNVTGDPAFYNSNLRPASPTEGVSGAC